MITSNTKKEKNGDIPENLPYKNSDENHYNLQFKISKKTVKNILRTTIIIFIIFLAAPRIINNVKSTIKLVETATEKFPIIFPTLTKTSSVLGSFTYNQIKDLNHFLSNNFANMAELLYSKKRNYQEETINSPKEKIETPVKIIIEKVGINTKIYNPISSKTEDLEKSLKYGVVRYPKSALLGENDNIYLFGHSTSIKIVRNQTYKSLNGLNKLKKGDIIKIQSKEKEYLYKVTSNVMQKNSEAIVKFNTGEKTLTISTCNTLGEKEDRFIVTASFITSYPLTQKETKKEIKKQIIQKPTTTKKTTKIEIPNTISNPYGKVDLAAEILEIGIIDKETNNFIATSTLSTKNQLAIKFLISNKGTKTAEGWTFNLVLPTDPFYIYHSSNQENLKPNESIEYMISFDKPMISEEARIVLNADPTSSFFESNEDNNIVKKTFSITE